MDWYLKVLRNYVGFGGRALQRVLDVHSGELRPDYGAGHCGQDPRLGTRGGEGILTTIYGVLVLLPSWAVLFRRLRHRSFGVVAAVAVDPAYPAGS